MSAIGSSYPNNGSNIQNYPKKSTQSAHFLDRKPSESLLLTRRKSSQLIEQATEHFDASLHPEPVSCILKRKEFPLILEEIFKTKGFKGLCIGENENYIGSKKLLIENMPRLKDLGVTTFFLEHIKADLHQKELDDWYAKRIATPVETIRFLNKLDQEFGLSPPYSFTDLVYEAHRVGIRVVAIDSSASAIAGNQYDVAQSCSTSKQQRIKALNFTAPQVMKKEKGNYIVLTGVDHGSTTQTYDKIPGISELMQCPFLIISDSAKYRLPGVYPSPTVPYNFGYRNKPGTVHAIIVVDKPISSPRRRTL